MGLRAYPLHRGYISIILLLVFLLLVGKGTGTEAQVQTTGPSMGEAGKTKVFYVSPSGHDGNPGTAEAPWATLAKVSREVQAGDTVLFMPGVYEGKLAPQQSGTPEEPITFRAAERRTATLMGAGGDDYTISLVDVAHIKIEGLRITAQTNGRWAFIERAKNIELTDVVMEKADNPDGPYTLMRVMQCKDLFVRDSEFSKAHGNAIEVNECQRVVFEGNAFSKAGHSPLQLGLYGGNKYLVIRGNVFHGAWGRTFELFEERYVLFEGNIITNAYNSGRSSNAGNNFHVERTIFRFNRIFRNWGGPLPVTANAEYDVYLDKTRFYHNVFDDNGHFGLRIGTDGKRSDLVLMNNIFSRNNPWGADEQIVLQDSGGKYAPGAVFLRNVLTTGVPGRPAAIGAGDKLVTLEQVQSRTWQQGGHAQFLDNLEVDPGFVDSANYNHALAAESALLDAGVPLTKAVGAGEGNMLPVADAAYFYDGFGIAGEVGDLIAVGSARQPARVLVVDYDANTLLLDRPVRWEDGDPVSLPWAGVAPDIGVYEHGEGGRVSLQVVAEPFLLRPGEEVRLQVIAHGLADAAVEYVWQLGDGMLAYGEEVVHRYSEENDYPVRVTAITAAGEIYRGTGYVVVAEPQPAEAPLLTNTFDADDVDWWRVWKIYRPTPVQWERILDENGNGILRILAPAGSDAVLPAWAHPVNWDVDQYPFLRFRYRIYPGTPLGLYLKTFYTWDPYRVIGPGHVLAIGTAASRPAEPALGPVLLDDGEWHDITIDVRLVRERFPELQVLEGMRFMATDAKLVRSSHGYELDEVTILPQAVAGMYVDKVEVAGTYDNREKTWWGPLSLNITVPGFAEQEDVLKVLVDGIEVYRDNMVPKALPLNYGEMADGCHIVTVIAESAGGTGESDRRGRGGGPRRDEKSLHLCVANVKITSPVTNAQIQGDCPVLLQVAQPVSSIQNIKIMLDDKEIYSGRELPTGFSFDTTRLTDGRHMLTVQLTNISGTVFTAATTFLAVNRWQIEDSLQPLPLGWGSSLSWWLSSATSGWRHAGDRPGDFGGDADRLVRVGREEEHLIWEAAGLTAATVTLYAKTPATAGISMAVSKDGTEWRALAYRLEAVERQPGDYYKFRLVAENAAPSEVGYFRLTLSAGAEPPADLQIGHVQLLGVNWY
ncbi:MAG TPA: hypothetical protein GXX29_04960 [Firmicutes bacterium]|nr:hypothetical protein [Bacillota bacterium]